MSTADAYQAVAGPRSAYRSAAGGLRSVWDAVPGALVQIDPGGVVLEWNPAAEQLLGWTAVEIIGHPLPAEAGFGTMNISRMLDRLRRGQDLEPVVLRCRGKDHRSLELEIRVAPVFGAQGQLTAVVGLFIDVTERQKLQRQLEHNAAHDPLTGLPNRALFIHRLRKATSPVQKTGVLLIDLDRFKEVNDTHGHGYGDQLLAEIGRRLLQAQLRAKDTVARWGGDEFAVLLPGLGSTQDALGAAHRISAALHRPFLVDGLTLDIEASIGVAIAPEHGSDPVTLLQHADTAMYEAKQYGVGVLAYHPDSGLAAAPTHLGLLGELRRALDQQQFLLHYQPQVDTATGRLHGVEALIRWDHPTRGLLSPAQFLPVAETTGLITSMTMTVLDLALAQARTWAEQGHRVPVAVNLSARCLHDRSLPARVSHALARHHVPADLLCLEITESMLMTDPGRSLHILNDLAAAGVALSIDDFGTGYSSLSYLRELPVTELKIDRSFIQDITHTSKDRALVRAAIELAHNLDLTVVAEGVEDHATLTALQELHCDLVQGYYLGKPMPARELTHRLTTPTEPRHSAHRA